MMLVRSVAEIGGGEPAVGVDVRDAALEAAAAPAAAGPPASRAPARSWRRTPACWRPPRSSAAGPVVAVLAAAGDARGERQPRHAGHDQRPPGRRRGARCAFPPPSCVEPTPAGFPHGAREGRWHGGADRRLPDGAAAGARAPRGTPSRRTGATCRRWRRSSTTRDLDPDRLRGPDLEPYAASLRAQGLAPSTVRRRLAAARSFLRHRLRIGARAEGVRDLPLPRATPAPCRACSTSSRCSRCWSSPTARRSGSATGSPWSSCTARACACPSSSGCDPGDVDRELAVVRCVGKGDRERIVPTGREAIAALDRYLARGRPFLGRTQARDALVLNARGRRLTRQGVFDLVRRHAAAAGPAGVGRRRTRCATRSRRTSSRAAPTCGRCRSCSATTASRRPRSTPTSRARTCARPSWAPTRGRAEACNCTSAAAADGVPARAERCNCTCGARPQVAASRSGMRLAASAVTAASAASMTSAAHGRGTPVHVGGERGEDRADDGGAGGQRELDRGHEHAARRTCERRRDR